MIQLLPKSREGAMTMAANQPEPAAPSTKNAATSSRKSLPSTIPKTNAAIEEQVQQYQALCDGMSCYAFMSGGSLTPRVVDDVFTDLRTRFGAGNARLSVILDSGGGDIDSAYNLAQLFRRYGTEELIFVVPRWAKSAATLLVCAGDRVLMTPVAELGPL